MEGTKQLTCPNAPPEPGAAIIGVVQASAQIAYVSPSIPLAGGKMNPARQAVISAGLSANVPSRTVNRACGSGAQAILSSAMEIWAGVGKAFIAGGMENMDRAPYLLPQRGGARAWAVFQKDAHNRADLSLEMLSRLKPAFKDGGPITAGNAPGLNSGAAAMIVAEKGGRSRQRSGQWHAWQGMA